MEAFKDHSIEELESLVATAPYSQYFQMLLAEKKNDYEKAALYQPRLGAEPGLRMALKRHIANFPHEMIPVERAVIDLDIEPVIYSRKETPQTVLPIKEPENSKSSSPKTNKQKKNKNNKKKNNFISPLTYDQLSPYSIWLLGEDMLKSQKKRIKKKKKKKRKFPGEESFDMVSEPLAALLAKQGHKEKAKGMYEKLIILFPEKEQVYRDQIENLGL